MEAGALELLTKLMTLEPAKVRLHFISTQLEGPWKHGPLFFFAKADRGKAAAQAKVDASAGITRLTYAILNARGLRLAYVPVIRRAPIIVQFSFSLSIAPVVVAISRESGRFT